MVMTFFFFAAFILAFMGLFFVHKSEKALNGTSWIVITLIAEICIGGVAAGVIGITPVPITLQTMSVIYLIIGVACILHLLWSKQRQQYEWHLSDILCMAVFITFCVLLCMKTYGVGLKFVFRNSDPAVHFENAMYVVRNHRLSGMWFASLYAGTLIEALSPFVAVVHYYKIYIIADTLAEIGQFLLVYILMRDYLTSWKRKFVGVIICFLYFGGYPMVCHYMGFFYWGICVLLIGFVLYMLRCYRTREIDRKYSVLFLMCGCAGIFLCYMLFAPIVYLAVLVSLIAVARTEGRVFSLKNVRLALAVFALPCALGLYYCYFQWFVSSGMSVSDVIATEGGMYYELYINFIWLVPFAFYWLLNRLKENEWSELVVFSVGIALFTFVLLLFAYTRSVSTYYYYKMYYPLWLMFFLVLPQAVFELYQKQRSMLASLAAVIAFLAGMSVTGIEDKIVEATRLTEWNHSDQFFDIYYYNFNYFKGPGIYDITILELCDYVIENLGEDDVEVPLLADLPYYGYAYWYDAITDKHSSDFYGWWYPFEEIQGRIDAGECDYIVVLKYSEIYQQHAGYFDSFETVAENDFGKVVAVANEQSIR